MYLVIDVHRLVGQFQRHLSAPFLDPFVFRHQVPYRHQVVLIVTTHLDSSGAYAGRTHNDIKPVSQRPVDNFTIERVQVNLQPSLTEARDIGFARLSPGFRKIGVVRPTGIQVQAEHRAIGTLGGVRKGREQFVEILDAILLGCIGGRITPTVIVEVGAGRVHHAMQHDSVAMGVHQVASFDMQRRKRLRTRRTRPKEQARKHHVFQFSHKLIILID